MVSLVSENVADLAAGSCLALVGVRHLELGYLTGVNATPSAVVQPFPTEN